MTAYDTWKLNHEDGLAEFEIYSRAVSKDYGVFAWQIFCQNEEQGYAEEKAWETCKKGPFITLPEKVVFWLNLLFASLKGVENPIHYAGQASFAFINEAYTDACLTVEETWKCPMPYCNLKAIQEDDGSIVTFCCEFESVYD